MMEIYRQQLKYATFMTCGKTIEIVVNTKRGHVSTASKMHAREIKFSNSIR